MIYYFKDDFIDSSEATVSVMSPSVQYGLNVFEGIRGYYDSSKSSLNVVELGSHLERLIESAKFLEIKHNYDISKLHEIVCDTLRINQIKEDIYLRIVLLYDLPGSWITNERALLLVAPLLSYPFDVMKPAISAKISSWERINGRSMPPRIKAGGNYLNSRLAQLEIKASGYEMAIFLNSHGFISEAPGSCVFLYRAGTFYTPALSSSILDSITRRIVIQIILIEFGKIVLECNLERIDFYQADEAFLCGTAIEITPLKSIDNIEFNNDGNVTRRIMQVYNKIILGELVLSGVKLEKI